MKHMRSDTQTDTHTHTLALLNTLPLNMYTTNNKNKILQIQRYRDFIFLVEHDKQKTDKFYLIRNITLFKFFHKQISTDFNLK